MKSLLLLAFMASFFLSAQENPWEPKKTENPWAVETEKADTVAKVDSSSVVIVDLQKTEQNSDQDLIKVLEGDAKDRLKAGGAFAVGFVSGIALNYPGALLATLLALPNTKQEKKIVEAVATDSTYTTINNDLATKKAKSAVKNKKILYSLLGSAAGAMTQLLIIFALIN